MTTPTFSDPALSWTIDADGVSVAQASYVEVREGVLPLIDSSRIVWRKATRTNYIGAGTPPSPTIPTEGSDLNIQDSLSAITLRHQIQRVDVSKSGQALEMEIGALGREASRMARAVAAESGIFTGYFNPHGQGNRKQNPGGSGIYDRDEGSGYLWTQDQAIRAIIRANGGTDTTAFSGLTRTGSWDTSGLTGVEALLTVLGVRGRRSIRIDGTTYAPIDLAPTTGLTAVNLNDYADLVSYNWSRDSANTFSDLRVEGAPDIEIRTVEITRATPDSNTGGLVRAWVTGDETNADAGDQESPAYRRFKVTGFNLVDGTPANLADLADRLPLSNSDLPSFDGSDAVRLWTQDGSGNWTSQRGKIHIFALDKMGIYIEGGASWVSTWKACTKMRITLAITNAKPWNATASGGVGTALTTPVTLKRDVAARRAILVASGTTPPNCTMLRTTTAGAQTLKATNTGDGNYYAIVGSTDLTSEAADLIPLVNRPRPTLTIVRLGIINEWPVGYAFGVTTLPDIGNVTMNAAVIQRIFADNGTQRTTTWVIGLPPFSLNARI